MKKTITVLFFSLLNSLIFAQNPEIDSLKEVLQRTEDKEEQISILINLSQTVRNYNGDDALAFANRGIEMAQSIGNDKLYKEALNTTIPIYARNGNLDTALVIAHDLLEAYEKTEDDSNILNMFNSLGILYSKKNDIYKSVQYLKKGLEHPSLEKGSDLEGTFLMNLASKLQKINKFDEALKTLFDALAIWDKLGATAEQSKVYSSLGVLFNRVRDYDNAIINLEKSYNILDTANLSLFSKYPPLVNLANAYNATKRYKKALVCLDSAYSVVEQLGYQAGFMDVWMKQIDSYTGLEEFDKVDDLILKIENLPQGLIQQRYFYYCTLKAEVAIRKNNLNEANQFIKKGEAIAQESSDNNILSTLAKIKSEYFYESGDYKKSYDFLLEYKTRSDSLLNQANIRSLAVQGTSYAFEKEKLLQEEVFKRDKAVVEEQLKRQRQTGFVLILLIAALLLAGWIAYRYFQTRNKALALDLKNKKIIEQQAQQLRQFNEELEATVAKRTAELKQANYELRTFNYIASHDIKEPIRNVGNYAGLIFRKLPNDLKTSLGSYFETIKRSTSQLYTLIEDFAKYTTMSRDEAIEKQPVDLNTLIYGIQQGLAESIEKYNGQVIQEELPTISSSTSLLYTALKNLIENGLKYNKSAVPTVSISHQETATHHQITVSDNGIGIPEEYHEKIFEMFKRLHNRGEYEGSGIGLAIVKLVTEKLGGIISVKSDKEGSQFVLQLPKDE